MLRDVPFLPTEGPSPGGVPVAQVIVTSEALRTDFQALADSETDRGIPTVVRTVAWVDSSYTGIDTPARIRTFLRDAHDLWGTEYAVLGGDVEHVPVRYVPWQGVRIPTDLYYECLDREWNEDGDAIFAEPLTAANLAGYVNDVAYGTDGKTWLGTNLGVTYEEAGVFTLFDSAGSTLPSDVVLDVDVGSDGAVWVGTSAGVATWNGASGWTSWGAADGLPSDYIDCILARSASDVWVGTGLGLAHWDGASWATWTSSDGMPSDAVTALAHDGTSLWIGTLAGAATFAGGTFTVYDTATSGILSNWVAAIETDGQGRVWFAHSDNFFVEGGLSRFDGVSWFTDDLAAFGGLDLRSLAFGPTADEIWAATPTGLFHRTTGGDELLTDLDGLAGADCNAVARGAGPDVLVAGAEGLSVGAPGAWTTYDETSGLPQPDPVYDDIDLVPDLALGRIPATDGAEVATYLQKLADYRAGLVVDHVESALLLGEVLFPGQDGKDVCEEAATMLPASFGKTGLYETDGTENTASVVAELDAGHGLVIHVGHGSYDVLGIGPDAPSYELLYNSQVDAVDSGGRYGYFVGYNCNSGGFDHESTVEHFLFNANGGAIGTMSNTRISVASLDADINLIWLEKLYASPHANPVLAFQETRDQLITDNLTSLQLATWNRRLYFSRSMLGAPTLALWRSAPGALSVVHPATVPDSRNPFPVTVTDAADGRPVADALVCVSKGAEDYAYGRTDSAGAVTFDFRPETPGTLSVVVTAPDHLPYEGSANVTVSGSPNPVANAWQRVVNPPFRTGIWDVNFALLNSGGASAGGWVLTLASSDPRITVAQPNGSLGALPASQIGWSTLFSIDVAPGVASGEEFELVLTGAGPSSFTETFRVSAEAPALELDSVVVSGGDLFPRITNLGAQSTAAITATLVSADTLGAVTDGAGTLPPLPPGASATFIDGFTVTGDPAARFQLQIQDGLGGLVTRTIDREPPAGASVGVSDPRDGGAFVTWLPSPAADLAGYRVYGRDPGGPWQDELGSPVTGGSMAFVPLAPASSRELLVMAVDESGHESPDSCFVTAHAAPPLLAGWPQQLWSPVGPSSMVAADLDGDGTAEVLHGSIWEANAVHAFLSDGTEWTDGDQNAATNGVFGPAGGRIVCAPLAVDVDGDGLKEVFVGAYDGVLYGWRTDGPVGQAPTPLPGFPVTVTASSLRSSPVAGDLDGDGDLEIVVVASSKEVHAFHIDGTAVTGWPKVIGSGGLHTTPAVHDLDGDGRDDVVFGGNVDSLLYAVSGDGTDLPGWPVAIGATVRSSPVLADIDGDDDLEVFVIAGDGTVHGFQHRDGDGVAGADPLPGWPVALNLPVNGPNPSPAVADLDGDGTPEIIVNGDGEVAVLQADGSAFPGTPIVTGVTGQASPVIADLDGDGSFEILATSTDFKLHAWGVDGSERPGWPRTLTELAKASPYVADIDADGDLDVVIGADDGRVVVVDVAGPDIPGAAPWPGYHGGVGLDGVYRHVAYAATGQPIAGPAPPGTTARLDLAPAAPNPFRGVTELRFRLPARLPVRLDVVDVRGRIVARVLRGDVLSAGAHTVSWKGRDSRGRSVASGVYFLRLEAGAESRTRKVLRLR